MLRTLVAVAAVLAGALGAQSISDNVTLLSKLHTKATYAGLWGWSSPGGREFALVGEATGTWIVEVTDPRNPREIGYFSAPASRWREITTYRSYLYSVSEAHSGARIVDMKDPESPRDLGLMNPGTTYWANCHTISVDPDAGRLYANGTYIGMVVMDVKANPENPPLLALHTGDFVHDSHHRRGKSYLSNYYRGLLRVMNSVNPAQLTLLSSIPTPGAATHDAWVDDDDAVLLVTDENLLPQPGYLQAYDIKVPAAPVKLGSYVVPGHVAHNVTILGRTAYAAWHTDGLHVIDITDPNQLKRVAWYDTSSELAGLNGAWSCYPFFDSGTVIVSDIQQGLFCLQIECGHLNRYGNGAPCGNGKTPRGVLAKATPAVGAAALEMRLADMPPNAKFALLVAARPASLHVGTVAIHVDPTVMLSIDGTADAQGQATVNLPIPNEARLARQKAWLQLLVLDASAPHGLAASRGMWFGVSP